MNDNLMAQITKKLCDDLHKKYGYSKKECMAYIKGYQDCAVFVDQSSYLDKQLDGEKEYYRIIIPDDDVCE